MTRLRPLAWFGLALLALLAFGFTAFVGAWAGGKDIDETCAAAGQALDQSYRAQHWQEPGQFFPMHNRCNADYDLVPGWVNPALVIFAVVAVACLVGVAAATIRLIRNSR
jgi:hypothetical protein